MNTAVISGNIATDIELKLTPSNVPVCSFNVAVRKKYRNADGEYGTDFIPCVAWRNHAEFISKYFSKGQGIIVGGSIEVRSWDADGVKHYKTELNVDNVDFVGAKKENQNTQATSFVNTTPTMPPIETAGNDDDLPF